MDTKFLFCFVVLFYVLVVVSADLNEIKRLALKKLETQIKNIKSLTDETVTEAEKREGNIKIIGKHEREYGEGILSTTLFQMDRNAKSGYMLANLLGSSNDVFRCIEFKHREAKDETGKYSSERFLKPGQEIEAKAEQIQRDQIKQWKDDYYKSITQYNSIYERSASEIQKSSSEGSINNIVRQFDQTTEQMAKIITSILPNMNKLHIEYLKIMENLVGDLKNFSKNRIQKTADLINGCFPKTTLPKGYPDLYQL